MGNAKENKMRIMKYLLVVILIFTLSSCKQEKTKDYVKIGEIDGNDIIVKLIQTDEEGNWGCDEWYSWDLGCDDEFCYEYINPCTNNPITHYVIVGEDLQLFDSYISSPENKSYSNFRETGIIYYFDNPNNTEKQD